MFKFQYAGYSWGKLDNPYLRGVKLILQLLERDPNKRLGYRPGGGGFEDIKRHAWFKGINWGALHAKEVIPPFEPDVSFLCRVAVDLNSRLM
jgi:hypothetical protein